MPALVDGGGWIALMLALIVMAVGVSVGVQLFPGRRHRYLFCSRPNGVVRFLSGEFSVLATVWLGGPLTALAIWWVCAMGYTPPMVWLLRGGVVWCGIWALALFNVARKSQLSGVQSGCLCLLIAGLCMVVVAGVWRELSGG